MSSASEPAILEMENICFSYTGTRDLIHNLSLTVCEAEFIGLLGANGSGKSTILKLGSGLLKAASGRISLWSKPFSFYNNRDRAKLISYLPQTLDMTIPFTVRELVGMGLYPYDIPPAMDIDEALSLVGLTDKGLSFLTDLSGGERRRVFIAMTLVQGAGLLLLDEPLANLDIKYQIDLVRLLKKLRDEKNISIIMALHDINIALHFETVMLIREGKILGIGSPEETLTSAMIKNAFDIDIKIIKQPEGSAYISYENNF